MRNLIALLAGSFITMAAGANDAPAPAAKTITDSALPKQISSPVMQKNVLAPVGPGAAALSSRAKEEQAEVDLSAKIAARLAEMRATQAARVAGAARARKAAGAAAAQAAAAPAVVKNLHGNHWSYEGESGPANWSKINSDWTRCGTGSRQSPIDIRDGMKVDLEQISFDYKPSSFNVVDNGHTVQVGVGGGNYLTVQGRMYELLQFHFHRPSEERINGKGYEMVVHLVHKDAEGKLAVLAILLERGRPQSTIQTVWNNLPLEKHEVASPSIVLDPMEMLPQRRDYFTYMGSLTTPPCSEGVLWLVMKEPQQASPAQMALFSRLYPLNARPIQTSSGRMIKESN
ncbi:MULTISPECIES: carbonic anhydrase [unclassified Janthinobacterium]|uniref:carbonic anhydrase n=1 Tax=unclassified Janthinobacterium TaxID=2610881 RepID=UPI00034776B1|nr:MULTISPECIES: carbonic anhydrase family protein [unclassified Janthinobacterium]MEC5159700.1 carbonic anhydrase [Janthinobacterium sp. CG_S6]